MKWHTLGITFLLLFTLSLSATAVSAGSAERIFSGSVNPGEEFQVTIKIDNYGAAGQVLEKIPTGFSFVSSTLPEKAVSINGNKISFLLMNEKSFSYTVKAPLSPGTYNFVGILRDTDKNQVSIVPSSSSLKVKGPSSGGSDSGSGSNSGDKSGTGGTGGAGGAGGSPEPQRNVEAKELAQVYITNGEHIKFEFPEGVTCIDCIEFDAKKTLGKITTTVEMLKGKSELVSDLPEGRIYKNVNVWFGTGGVGNPENIQNATVGFKVNKAWINKNKVDPESITLWHYDKIWNKLETKQVNEDNNYIYFEAKTPGFGHFVIVESQAKVLESTDSKEITSSTPETSESKPASDSEKSSDEGLKSLPGFESTVAVGILGTAYCIFRKKT